jgi:hypothetical protein
MIVIVFEKGVVGWDEDLFVHGRVSLETLIHVGMGIGTGICRAQEGNDVKSKQSLFSYLSKSSDSFFVLYFFACFVPSSIMYL